MMLDEIIDAECRAEDAIREILRDLENDTGLSVDYVKVGPGCDVSVNLKLSAALSDSEGR